MSDARKRQLESDISGLESDNRRARGEISNLRSLLDHVELSSSQGQGYQREIKNKETFIQTNEQRIREMQSELRKL